MKKVVIAFDVDGTLIDNRRPKPVANERIRDLIVTLASFKNTRIIVWSGGGELYARQAAAAIGVDHYVDGYASKNMVNSKKGELQFEPEFIPDIAFDDIQSCELGKINLICKEK